ncbi:MAG: hypothetical protein QOD99_1782 [Chthoniobacter sp.]|jgi:hypothetical protein|nr:hypothetical protein [Chthoniobacter sp.]
MGWFDADDRVSSLRVSSHRHQQRHDQSLRSETSDAEQCRLKRRFRHQRGAAFPDIAPGGGTFVDTVSVALSTNTPGALIRYTTDGSSPQATSAVYSAPFILTRGSVVNAVAVSAGMVDSVVSSSSFTVLQTVAAPVIMQSIRLAARLSTGLMRRFPPTHRAR